MYYKITTFYLSFFKHENWPDHVKKKIQTVKQNNKKKVGEGFIFSNPFFRNLIEN